MARSTPSADDKIGKKIDFVAAELGDALKPLGFRRQGRRLWHETAEAGDVVFHLLDLQGDQWNAGSQGRFTLNLGVQRPALTRQFVELSGQQFHLQGIDQPFGTTCIDGRLGAVLPAEREPDWLPELEPGVDVWFTIGSGTDLAALAAGLARAVQRFVPPWFARHGTLAGLWAGESGAMPIYPVTACRLIAGVRLGHTAEVATLFAEKGSVWFASPSHHAAVKTWLLAQGVAVADVAFVPRQPGRAEQQRQAQVAAAKHAAAAAEREVRAAPMAAAAPLNELLDAQVTIERARLSGSGSSAVTDRLLQADAATRQQAVLLALRKLQRAPVETPSTLLQVYGNLTHVHDDALGQLIVALLKSLPCDEAFARQLLQALQALAPRFSRPGLVCMAYEFPMAALVAWLFREARPWSEALKPEVQALFDAVRATALAEHDSGVEATRQRAARPGADEFTKQLAAADHAATRRRIAGYPEQSFEKAEREAIGQLRRWLRRHADGSEPLCIEDDDWGRQLKAAVAQFPGDRASLETLLQQLASFDLPARPTARQDKQLDGWLAGLRSDATQAWLDALLRAYAHSDLGHEWATTGPRPGVGAFVGETSGALLVGLLHLARRWDAAAFAPAIADVVDAGFTLVPGVRMRSQKAAGAAVEGLAASAAGRTLIAGLRQRHTRPAMKRIFDAALAAGDG